MTPCCRRSLATLLLCCVAGANAADDEPAPPEAPPQAPAAAASAPATQWEGAIGPVLSLSPEYQGAARRKVSAMPGFYLRYGRLSISNASGFVNRRKDDVLRGLGLDVLQQKRLRVNLGLRVDAGRRSSDSATLAGISNVRRTLRLRASTTWQIDDHWKLGAGWTTDLLGRGGGQLVDLGLGHDLRLSERTTWNVGGGLNWASGRYMQSYYGVTAAESVASGYPAYAPGAGLRDASLGTSWRMEINPRWTGFWGGSVGRLLGPAAASPLTKSTRQWSLNGALAWRF